MELGRPRLLDYREPERAVAGRVSVCPMTLDALLADAP
jgi:hypothetical protein